MEEYNHYLTVFDLQEGQTASMEKTVSEKDIAIFADVTGDYNPLHMDDAYAAQTRFKKRIGHGALLTGMISAVLGMKLPGPGALYVSQSLKFLQPVYIGDTITARVQITEINEGKNRVYFATSCENQKHEIVAEGESLLLPYKQRTSDN